MPVFPLGILFLFVVQVIRVFDKVRLTVADSDRSLICWIVIAAILIVITVIRTPKHLRGEGLFIWGLFCVFCPIHFLQSECRHLLRGRAYHCCNH
mgnify:CR=1 FL=1